MNKMTKQGVRDLNTIKAPPAGYYLEEPPIPINCKHKNRRDAGHHGATTCIDCGEYFDW